MAALSPLDGAQGAVSASAASAAAVDVASAAAAAAALWNSKEEIQWNDRNKSDSAD